MTYYTKTKKCETRSSIKRERVILGSLVKMVRV